MNPWDDLMREIARRRHVMFMQLDKSASFIYLGARERELFEQMLYVNRRYSGFSISEEQLKSRFQKIIWEGAQVLYVNTESHLEIL